MSTYGSHSSGLFEAQASKQGQYDPDWESVRMTGRDVM